MANAISEIIERLERASGPDRELDLDISVAVNFKEVFTGYEGWHWNVMGDEIEAPYVGKKRGKPARAFLDPAQFVPRWTASIDAALTLVPEGFKWKLGFSRHVPCVAEVVSHYSEPFGSFCGECDSNHAIALCIAALRARSHKET